MRFPKMRRCAGVALNNQPVTDPKQIQWNGFLGWGAGRLRFVGQSLAVARVTWTNIKGTSPCVAGGGSEGRQALLA
jgi:hypothetical protein